MSQQQYDVAGLGNAIVDIIASVDDRFLLNHKIAKGGMTLIDEFRAHELLKALADDSQSLSGLHEIAGGSAANTMAGIASLGGNGVRDRHDIRLFNEGVPTSETPLVSTGRRMPPALTL